MKHHPGYWNFNTILEAAKTCTHMAEFKKRYPGAADRMWMLRISTEIYKQAGLLSKYTKRGTWTIKENVHQEARKYKHRKEFEDNSAGAYDAAQRYGWLDDICAHMIPQANLQSRALYAFEFSDKSVYIGLTWNYNERYKHHLSCNKIIKEKRQIHTETFVKYNDFYPMSVAGQKELELIEKYRNEGWVILNKAKAGALGGNRIKWTFDACLKELQKYETKREFQLKSQSCYMVALRRGWIAELYKIWLTSKNESAITLVKEIP